ncbi:hypothetical protein CASFOL_018877 [Castilleja foliolosa]|uniref:Calmodulin-binding domain-containing protein n=1 Tax=Castilleja foliolosa TaxID=1961234 RepID=A0ABD3D2V1_9LAMI
MAEEITTIPEKYKLDCTEMDSNSAENPPHSPSSARRHSLSDKPNTTKRRVPIHLRASTGSCHDFCKFGKKHSSEEKTREPFRKRISKSLPNKPMSSKTIVSEASRTATSKSSLNGPKPVKTASSVENTKKQSPRQSALSINKTVSKNISCSVSEQPPEIIKREILLSPSEKVEAPVEEGSSNGNKISKADKKASDHSVIRSSSEKAKLFKANKPLVASGKKMMPAAGKASEAPSFGRLYLGKTATSKAREEAGRVKLSLSSPVKHKNRTEKSNGEASEKTLHVIKTKTEEKLKAFSPKAGGVKPSSPSGRSLEIRVIKAESENSVSTPASSPLSSSHAKSPSISPREDKNENEKIQTTVSIETEENQASLKSLLSSSHEEDDNETIGHSNNETGELIEDKIVSSEIDNHDTNTTSSLSEEEKEEEEIYQSSSKSSSHSRSSSLLSLEENDEEINGELVSDKTVSTDIGKSKSPKENRKTLRKSLSIRSANKNNCLPVKLKFRRGKIIDLQPENNVPKRLKFRRVRNSDNNNKMDDFVPKGKKSIITETSHVKSGSPPNRILRKADSFRSDYKKKSTDVKQETPNRSLRKSRSVPSEDKHRSVVSLSRREKSVDSQTDNNSPTRLKFLRGRALRVGDAKSDSWRRNIKKSVGNNEAVGFEASSRNVVLKPSEVQRKNNEQVLLNNVIEETASKLVESRKSKVKALVGAFETVILLNETKPAVSSHSAG